MCIIFFAVDRHPAFRLVLIANRDEFYERPTKGLHRWDDDFSHICAGRDLVGGGMWLGVTDGGRFAAVTNYRDPDAKKGLISRGCLVAEFLKGETTPQLYMQSVAEKAAEFSGFNLIVGSINSKTADVYYFSNRGSGIEKLGVGIYGLSNSLLDTAWPKVRHGKEMFTEQLGRPDISREGLFELLADDEPANDDELPDTGIGYEREKALSSIFITTPVYGTRSSSVLSIDNDFGIDFKERVFA